MAATSLAACVTSCSSTGDEAGRGTTIGAQDDQGSFIEDDSTEPVISDPDPAPIVDDGAPGTDPGDGIGDGELIDGLVCNSKDVAFEKVIPTVMILVDRSSSMFDSSYAASPNRWEPMREAVLSLEDFTDDVAFSFVTYTAVGGDPECPAFENMSMVPATGNFEDIKLVLQDATNARPQGKGETPTGEAISAAVENLAAIESDGPKYLLVITDGEPDTCFKRDPQCGQDWAIASTQAAFAQGIQTFVVGISEDVQDNFLNDLAHAGQGRAVPVPPFETLVQCSSTLMEINQQAGNTGFDFERFAETAMGSYDETATYDGELFFKPDDLATLQVQLGGIIAGVRSCGFEMDTAIQRAAVARGAVALQLTDGTTEVLTHGDSWDLSATDDSIVEIKGAACDKILDRENDLVSNVRIEFPCEIRIPKMR